MTARRRSRPVTFAALTAVTVQGVAGMAFASVTLARAGEPARAAAVAAGAATTAVWFVRVAASSQVDVTVGR